MLTKKYNEDGHSLSSFDNLILEPFTLKNPLIISDIMKYVNGVGFYRRLGIHRPHIDKSKLKRRLSIMREWELI